jgi:hypothetical protein
VPPASSAEEPAAVAAASAGDAEHRAALRLLFLLPFPPRLDARHGGARAAAHIIAAHATRHEVAVLYLRSRTEQEIGPALRPLCRLVEEVRIPRSSNAIARLLYRAGVAARQARGMPYWPASVGGSYVAARIRRLVREWRPDVVRLEFLPMGQFADAAADGGAPVVLAAHDSFAESASEELASTYRMKRAFAALQLARWRRYERSIVRRADAVVTFKARDRAAYERASEGSSPVL